MTKGYRRPMALSGWERRALAGLKVRRLIWAAVSFDLVPLVLGGLLTMAILNVGPAWSAMLGHGVHGTFTAENCRHGIDGCSWQGNFVSDDGNDRRDGVEFGSGNSVTQVGQRVAALDTGDGANVYPAGGSEDWAVAPVILLLSLVGLAYWTMKVPVAGVRQYRLAKVRRTHAAAQRASV